MKILVAVDGSEYSQWAIDALALFGGQPIERVTLIHTISTRMPKGAGAPTAARIARAVRKLDEQGATLLRTMAQRASLALGQGRTSKATTIETTLVHGKPSTAILRHATRRQTDLVLVGSRGVSDLRGFLLGSVSRYVSAHCPCPIVIVKRPLRSLRRLVLAVDASRQSRTAADFVAEHFIDAGTQVTVMSVVSGGLTDVASEVLSEAEIQRLLQPQLDRAETLVTSTRARLLPLGCAVTTKVASGHPSEAILSQAKSAQADLIAVGSRGLEGVERLLLGSVAESVLKYAPCSVVIVRQRQTE